MLRERGVNLLLGENPNIEKLREFFAGLKNIPWLSPTNEPNASHLQECIDTYLASLDAYNARSIPRCEIKIVRDWLQALKLRHDTSYDKSMEVIPRSQEWWSPWTIASADASIAAKASNRSDHFTVTYEAADQISTNASTEAIRPNVNTAMLRSTGYHPPDRLPSLGIGYNAGQAASWIIVEDLMPRYGYNKGNPWAPIMEINKQGYCFLGFVNREAVIFVPPISQSQKQSPH